MIVDVRSLLPRGLNHSGTDDVDAARDLPTQAVLPLYRSTVRSGAQPHFAHPAELELARVFTFFGIRWSYEPTTFTLPELPDGRPVARFTPDFFLPDHNIYLELTTMRQRLVTRKNSKVRRMHDAYPNVRIKLVYRRDFARLMNCYRGALSKATERDIVGAFASAEAIECRVDQLASVIAERCLGQRPVLLGLGKGAKRFHTALAERLDELGVDADLHRIGMSRSVVDEQRVRVRIRRTPAADDLAGRDVIIVTDVVSSGLTLAYVQQWLQRRGPRRQWTCTLLDRPTARLIDATVDLAGFTATNDALVGYGLQLRPNLAYLPYIGVLKSSTQLGEIV